MRSRIRGDLSFRESKISDSIREFLVALQSRRATNVADELMHIRFAPKTDRDAEEYCRGEGPKPDDSRVGF